MDGALTSQSPELRSNKKKNQPVSSVSRGWTNSPADNSWLEKYLAGRCWAEGKQSPLNTGPGVLCCSTVYMFTNYNNNLTPGQTQSPHLTPHQLVELNLTPGLLGGSPPYLTVHCTPLLVVERGGGRFLYQKTDESCRFSQISPVFCFLFIHWDSENLL